MHLCKTSQVHFREGHKWKAAVWSFSWTIKAERPLCAILEPWVCVWVCGCGCGCVCVWVWVCECVHRRMSLCVRDVNRGLKQVCRESSLSLVCNNCITVSTLEMKANKISHDWYACHIFFFFCWFLEAASVAFYRLGRGGEAEIKWSMD